jgi:hypothetical protein
MGVGVASLGIPVGIGVLHPVLGEALTIIEVVVVLTVIATALFGNLATGLSRRDPPPIALAAVRGAGSPVEISNGYRWPALTALRSGRCDKP